MLDFYLISDSAVKPKPDKLHSLDYVGGLESDIYDRLIKKGIIDSRFDYYSNFRWGNQLVRHLDSKIKEFGSDSDVSVLKRIIEIALSSGTGLIAYGD
ncbi:hypothetical protein [Flammeovirga sp. SJP92]|uniref:hypothetical protein n=1 Tax=Flammeovirga sp. SJP92 TaxID=1775430 RepID=UPI00078974E4|nr:hypothetical protein [Flammeovirga sp. SJP92]KXX69452.1 hypothetical protein AVL50_19055 [Flammeovirga sp. SJP92]